MSFSLVWHQAALSCKALVLLCQGEGRVPSWCSTAPGPGLAWRNLLGLDVPGSAPRSAAALRMQSELAEAEIYPFATAQDFDF